MALCCAPATRSRITHAHNLCWSFARTHLGALAAAARQSHTFTYDEPMGVEALTCATCDLALRFGEDNDDEDEGGPQMSRPFGVALLFGGVDSTGPKLYHADPSGYALLCCATS